MDTSVNGDEKWKFIRLGGSDHVRLDKGSDIANLDKLDRKNWAALGCPVQGLQIDKETLKLIDLDGDGRIRAPELLNSITWVNQRISDLDLLISCPSELPLDAFNVSNQEGRDLQASAKQILEYMAKKDKKTITIQETGDIKKIFDGTKFNGDGIIPPESSEDEGVRNVIKEIIDCCGFEIDRSGLQGVNTEKLELFFKEIKDYEAWRDQLAKDRETLLPLGDDTFAAAVAYESLYLKIEDFFIRCNLLNYDRQTSALMAINQQEVARLSLVNLCANNELLMSLPLALTNPEAILPLSKSVNPAWQEKMTVFCEKVVFPLLGKKEILLNEDWEQIKKTLSPHMSWKSAKKGILVEKLGVERIQKISESDAKEKIANLIENDLALKSQAESIGNVDKFLRLSRDLYRLLNNFVSFRNFYSRKTKGIFQNGELFIDGKSFELCILVEEAASHSVMASKGGIFLVYCDCSRRSSNQKMTIVAAMTNGDSDNIMVGKNGIFYDSRGDDWDAKVIKIVEHPISIKQAFWSPYKRISKLIKEQIETIALSKEKAMHDKAASGIADTSKTIADASQKPQPAPFDIGKFAGVFAAIGLAIGAIGTALAAILTGFLALRWWQMPLSLLGLMLLISGPSMAIAYLKLRERNLAPLLDANGWAINSSVKINIPFGNTLTHLAKLPPGAKRSLSDPFEEKHGFWKWILAIIVIASIVVAGWKLGVLKDWKTFLNSAPPAATEEVQKTP